MNIENNAFKPISFWSWNGDMRDEEIRWQINEFKEKGFGGFFIHSRAGLLTEYLSEDWFHACTIAIEEAEKIGMDAWLYDEDGWPSGFAGGRVNGCGEDYCAKTLCFSEGEPSMEGIHTIAVYRKKKDGSYSRIEKTEGNEKDLYCYYQIVPHYVDIMDKNVISKFIEVTHETYKKHFQKYFGNVIKGIFTDEPQMPGTPCWSLCLEEKYQKKYDEDILEHLWLMYVDADGYQKFRYCYWSCVNELIKENYVGQISDWCNQNKLLLTGHFSSEDGLCEQAATSGGVMPLYEKMGLPAIDHLGNRFASGVLLKQVTSVAHQKGCPYVLSESFGCAGWDISFKELLGIAGWHAVFGVNTLCTHVSAYTIVGRRKRDYPAFFSYQEPWWEDTRALFDAIRKLNTEIGRSRRNIKVGVLHPIRSVWCSLAEKTLYDAKFLSAEFRELVNNLLDIHIDFDLVDEGIIKQAVKLYSLIIVPECITLSKETVEELAGFASTGGTVIFMNGRPATVEGDETDPLVEQIHQISALELQNTRNILQKYFRAHPIQDDYRLYDARLENEVSGIVSHYGKTEEGAVAYLFNPMSGHDIHVNFCHKGSCRIEVVNLLDDKKENITSELRGDYTYASLTIESGTGVLLQITMVETQECISESWNCKSESLDIKAVNPTEDNCLTLDYGRFQIQGGAFSKYKAVIHMLDEIYAQISGNEEDSEVCIEYNFHADFKKIPSHMALAVEKMDNLQITLNGHLVTEEIGWWIDKGIMKYDISQFVVNGNNVVLLKYTIPSTRQVNDLAGKFESERNRFFYKVEPESIYICGEFDVRCNVNILEHPTYYSAQVNSCEETIFTLVDKTEKTCGELTRQGMWFYRGNCEYISHMNYDGSGRCYLSVDAIKDNYLRIYVNKVDAGLLIGETDEVDITEYLQKGTNEVIVLAVGHNRNLFGPHHHIRGQLYFVGPHTYIGVKEFEDFVNSDVLTSSTWTDNYSFAPFGIRRIQIKRLERQ